MRRRSSFIPALDAARRQRGQALVESLAALLGLAVLWVALHWLAHYQDAALSATHASRHAAFLASRGNLDDSVQAVAGPFFTGSAHRWTDRRSQEILDPGTSVKRLGRRMPPLSELAQPGAGLTHAAALRRDWSLEDTGILRAEVSVDFKQSLGSQPDADPSLLQLRVFDLPYPSLARSTSILTGAGHAVSDTDVQSRVAASSLAWSAAHAASRLAGSEVNLRAEGVEAGWGRAAAGFDWLQPWSGRVPGHLVTDHASPEGGH